MSIEDEREEFRHRIAAAQERRLITEGLRLERDEARAARIIPLSERERRTNRKANHELHSQRNRNGAGWGD